MPGPHSPASRADVPRGFSFVELMVVLAILSFAFAYSVLHLDGATGSARLSSAARQVGSTIEVLRAHAVQARRPIELYLDLDHGKWRIVLPPRPSEREVDRRDAEEVLYTEDVFLPPNIRFEGVQLDAHDSQNSGELVLTFSPLGEIAPNGFMVRLVSDEIADDDLSRFSIEVNGLTGEVAYIPGFAPFDQVVRGDAF